MLIPNTTLQLREHLSPESAPLVLASKEKLDSFLATAAMTSLNLIGNHQTPYGEHWLNQSTEGLPVMLERLKGKMVVDLGAGASTKFRERLAQEGVAGYIGVDYIGHAEDVAPLTIEKDGVDGAILGVDMLEAVDKLPDASCSFAINGIDSLIVRPDTPYAQELVRQIDRVTAVDGYILGNTLFGGILEAFSGRDGYETEEVNMHGMKFISHHKVN